VDPSRAIADLRELDRLTGGAGGARRVCWTEEWRAAREFLRGRLADVPADLEVEVDAAGNLWATLAGREDAVVAVGSHLDSVPSGGWLDGALGVMAALEVLRGVAESGEAPRRSVALVDWADEEGARFGRSLLGSSAFAGTLDAGAVRGLSDADGIGIERALAENGVELDAMGAAGNGRVERLAAYLELHIEQGPVLEAEGLACGAVLGTAGVERHRVVFTGRAAHAGSTPMDRRSDAAVAAARVIVALQQIAREHGGVCTAGRLDCEPGIVTAVPGRAELLIDQRHLDPAALGAMRFEAQAAWEEAAEREGCTVEGESIWRIDPVPFDDALIAAARECCREVTGAELELPSGALHDASELARIVPTGMIFAASVDGVSHAPGEDTSEEDLTAALSAFGALAERVIAGEAP
jgi:hydantoinase/carbamoylase family amidase